MSTAKHTQLTEMASGVHRAIRSVADTDPELSLVVTAQAAIIDKLLDRVDALEGKP